MSDDLTRKGPEDPTKINVNQSWEVDYWIDELGVAARQLRDAVNAVGPLVVDVKLHLGI